MKKLMSLLVLASVGMFLVGCGEGDTKKKAETTTKSTVTKPTTDSKESKDK